MIETLKSNLTQLRLSTMAQALELQMSQPNTYRELSFEERLNLLVEQELTERSLRRRRRLIARAHFKLPATGQDIDYRKARNLHKSQLATLLSGDWILRHLNLLITGPTGCGKSHLACAIGDSACRQGLSVTYHRLSRLLEEITLSHGDGSFLRTLRKLAKVDLLILDDWGLENFTQTQRRDLLEIMDDRHNTRSTLVASQLPVDQWHTAIGDATMADAILDRLIHNAHRLPLKGESMRKRQVNTEDLSYEDGLRVDKAWMSACGRTC